MPQLDERSGALCFKVVFCGPGHGGKSTALRWLHSALPPARRGKLVCLPTETGRTVFFDFLPVRIGVVPGVDAPVRFHFYTAPGQVFYGEAQRLVLRDVDGVVFVADSRTERREANASSLESLKEGLAAWGIDYRAFPLLFLYNKRDVEDRLSVAELRRRLNQEGKPEYEAVATAGVGVAEMLDGLCETLIARHRSAMRR